MDLKGYTNIPDWMLELDLDVYETIILAVIYGFSQDGDSSFKGSRRYLSSKAKCSLSKVEKGLKHLVELKLVNKTEVDVRGMKLYEYQINSQCTIYEGVVQGTRGVVQGTTNNIDNNIDNNTHTKEEKKKFTKPTLDQIQQHITEKAYNVDAEMFFAYYESNGWMVGKSHMKNWKMALLRWSKTSTSKPAPKASTKKESVFAHNLKVMDKMFGTNTYEQTYGKGGNADEQ